MTIIDFSTRRPVSVIVFTMAAIVFGLVAFQNLAVDLLPDITYPSLTIRTEYEGVAPAEIESLVTRPVENGVGVVNNVVKVSSSSRADISEVTLEFAWGTNMDMAALDVRERLDLVQLPDEVASPILLRFDPSLDPVMRIGLTGGNDLIQLRLVAEREIERALERVEGVAAVVVSGGLEEEIQIEVDERRMASLGLSIATVGNRLAQENINLTGGRLREGQTEYLVRTINEFGRPDDMQNIVIDKSTGSIVRLSDIARIVRGHKEREAISRINALEAVEIAVYKEGGTNSVTVVDAVTEQLGAVREKLAGLGGSMELTVVTDQARYIRQSINDVLQTAAIGGSLAILVLLLFLGSLKPTVIIGLSIPISVIATFFLMYVWGISLNIMSLGGLTLGIGMLVDNSIVVLEAIQRKRDEGLGVVDAARVGASEVGQAVIASTMTTVCVFVPIVFVEGVAGQLFGDQALTVTFSLAVSLVVALTLIPMLASREFVHEAMPPVADVAGRSSVRGSIGRLPFTAGLWVTRAIKFIGSAVGLLIRAVLYLPEKAFSLVYGAIERAYPVTLDVVLTHRVVVLLVTGGLLAGSLLLFNGLGQELMPELIQGEFNVSAELRPGTQLAVTSNRLDDVEVFAQGLDGVKTVYAVIGTSGEQGGIAGEQRENIAELTVTLFPPISREREEVLMAQLRPMLAAGGDVQYRFSRPSYFSFRTPIEVEIRGYNLNLLSRLADDLVTRMESIAGLTDVKSSTEGGNPELQIRFNRERLAALGYTVSDVATLVRSKVLGDVATDLAREDRTVDIRLRVDEQYRDSSRDLANLNIASTGTPMPLSSVAEVLQLEGPAEIRRADGERTALITANLVGRDLGSASAEISGILESTTFPSGFDYRIGGQRQEMETSFQSLQLAIGLAVFMVYLVMASQFESLLHPLVILFSVPLSAIGVLGTLYLFNVTVSIVVLIGVVMLAGIVVNNAIILIDYTNRLRREGMKKLDALRKAGQVRLRPIMMTTSTTVLGLLPMAIGIGEGSELRSPMAITVIGGLITSTALTLLIIPAVYSLLDRSE